MEFKTKNIKCVLMGCDSKATIFCNNCNIPICEKHGKRVNQGYLCINCYEYTKKLRQRF